jgi:hypothetical protein
MIAPLARWKTYRNIPPAFGVTSQVTSFIFEDEACSQPVRDLIRIGQCFENALRRRSECLRDHDFEIGVFDCLHCASFVNCLAIQGAQHAGVEYGHCE